MQSSTINSKSNDPRVSKKKEEELAKDKKAAKQLFK